MGTLTTFNFHDINFIGVSNVYELTYADRLETDTPSVIYVVHFFLHSKPVPRIVVPSPGQLEWSYRNKR